ncbi:hypothetical protein GCM10023115_19340 [Pontixanthobacter gangjinensis]|uniref:AlpA family phage regulatory protein n=1 Tax=Pontixanthobacter gangjinensis TaxID=1028742 RepID=A0A6I4SN94_9SPHN|nr:AlpA family phage regulatory protein [Pontixanthobacter gangjinensis]MXO57184.1 AlpA family phage regulatory protein [Pontixanthobacter gangjinensis]
MTERLLRLESVEDRIGLKKSKIYDMIGRGQFPRPVKLGACNAWPENEILAWIADRVKEREAA